VRYTVVIEKGRESGFVAHCPALKGCVSQGKTEQKALANLRDAMQDYLETLAEDGLPLPVEVARRYVDIELPNLYREQILARAAKLTRPEIVQRLLAIHKKYSPERRPTEASKMFMLWPTDDPPDALEATEPLDEINETFGLDIEEDEAGEIYDMTIREASHRLAALIKAEQEQTE